MKARMLVRALPWIVGCAQCTISRGVRAGDAYRTALGEAVAVKERALDSGSRDHWMEVLVCLRRVNEIRETAESEYEIGFAASQLGYDDVAVEAYQRALSLGLTGVARDKAQAFVVARSPGMARLVVHGPDGWTLTINGVKRTSLPLAEPVLVRPGQIHVALDAGTDGVGHWERQFDVTTRALNNVAFELPQAHPKAPTTLAPRISAHSSSASYREPAANQSHATPAAETRFDWRRAGIVLSGTGVTLSLVSALFLPLTSSRIGVARKGLRDNCDVPGGGPDSCAHAQVGRQALAQSFSDSIGTWKAARTVSWSGLAIGISAAATGVSALLLAEPTRKKAAVAPRLSFDRTQVQLGISGSF